MVRRSDASWDAAGVGEWGVRAGAGVDGFDEGDFLGVVAATVKTLAGGGQVLNLGYRFAPRAWGRGFAGEAARTVLAAVEAAGIRMPVTARVLADNPASIRVLDRLPLELVWRGRSEAGPDAPATARRERLIYADRPLETAVLDGVIALG
ncbi:GNAT family N-acetyltransferase [Agromyces seonyuensis]|uniref:GNAT family N-acetyltransferase n=1 Tax=Agromyces seonyuensis TaxID=2662446 RepID=A0A6I4P554_9MICO|nr:GNAT family protein [Agromyces seonyuensis]MWC00126.1 GNAT family N-acetyltransferase [Agromyces seonyuensis]